MKKTNHAYPDLDFTPLLGDGRYVVHCTTAEEAEHFLAVMKRRYPKRCNTWTVTRFGKYDDGICYRPNLNMPEGYPMVYCSLEYYEEEGYTIIPFSNLLPDSDIEESEQPIDFLLRGVMYE